MTWLFLVAVAEVKSRSWFFIYTRKKKGIIMNTKNLSRRMLIVVMSMVLCLQAPSALAGIVSTSEMAAQNQTVVERAKIQAFIDRAGVKDRLQAMGVDGIMAKDRVAALSDQEVHALALKIDSMPAGGDLRNMSNSDLIVILLVVILIAIIV
jgi:hypothetical protein